MSDTTAPTPYTAQRRRGRKPAEAPTVPYERASAAQLARQPPGRQPRHAIDMNWQALWGHLQARLTMLISWRYSWMTHYQLLEAYILPRRGIFINPTMPTPNTMQRGQVINQDIIDPTGTQAMRICAAGLMSGLMSPGRPWFKLKPAMFPRDQLPPEAVAWMSEVEDRIYQVMERSNFYQEGAQMFEDITVFGTGPMLIYEDVSDIIRCYLSCPGEYYLAVGPDGRINGFARMFVWTVQQIVEFFGVENCPPDVQGLWQSKGGGLEVEKIVAHFIEPNFEIEAKGAGPTGVVDGGFTWREAYWCWGTNADYPLSLRGFNEAPFVCPRWATTSNDAYGRSVGMDVLQDIMQLQVETMRKAEAIEKMVRPPVLASIELKNEPSSTVPGGVTYVSSLSADKGMRPIYTVNPEIKEMMADIEQIQMRIKTGFFNDLFLRISMDTREKTAYEVAQIRQELLQVLGPVTERFNNEFASPAIKRIARIMERKGLMPPLPESLHGVPLGIEFVSPLAMAQRASSTTSMERYAQVVGNLSGIYPEARAKIKVSKFLDVYADLIGVPVEVVGSDEDVAKMLEMIQKQQQQAQAGQMALAATQGAKNLGQTEVGGGVNALQLMAGRVGAGAPQQAAA